MKDKDPIEANNELKNELLHALFALKNLNLHKLGQQEFGFGGGSRKRCMAAERHGLNIPEFAMLKQLKLREEKGETGGAWLSEMGEYLRVSKAAVSQMLGALEKRGVVTREPDPGNRRTIIVSLTDDGREMIDGFERDFDNYLMILMERFGEKDTREIIRLIYKFSDIIESIIKEQTGAD